MTKRKKVKSGERLLFISKLVCRQCELFSILNLQMEVMQNNILIEATGKHFVLMVEKKIEEVIFSAN